MCLWDAIFALSISEIGSFAVFSGLHSVKLDRKSVDNGYFVTYVSTSWRKEVAMSFMKGEGMMIQFDKKYKDSHHVLCCDVSWISKFPDECEILFARSLQWKYVSNNNFSCYVLDEHDGIQTIIVKDQ